MAFLRTICWENCHSYIKFSLLLSKINLLYLCDSMIGFPGGSVVRNPLANARNSRDASLIPGLGRSPRSGNDNSLQYIFLKNPINRGVWWAIFHRTAKSWTQLSDWKYTTGLLFIPLIYLSILSLIPLCLITKELL